MSLDLPVLNSSHMRSQSRLSPELRACSAFSTPSSTPSTVWEQHTAAFTWDAGAQDSCWLSHSSLQSLKASATCPHPGKILIELEQVIDMCEWTSMC